MIIDDKHIDVFSGGDPLETTKVELDKDNIGFIIQVLSKFYSDGPGSTIREWVSNAFDSHVEAGVDAPILVNLKYTNGQYIFSVQDFGIGINQESIDTILRKYGKSTKRLNNNQLGAFGLGAKVGLSYKPFFTITGVRNGMKGQWIFREGEDRPTVDTIYNNINTDEGNGATFSINVDYFDKKVFSTKIREQLCYFRNIFVTDDYTTFNNNFIIYEGEHFKCSDITTDHKLHICLGDVYYPIDWNKLGISQIEVPIGLKFSLEDGIKPIENRENIRYTSESKQIIIDKIKKAASEILEIYNKNILSFKRWEEGRRYIKDKNFTINLGNKQFIIDGLIRYSDIQIKNIEIEGFNSKDINYLYSRERGIISNYNLIGSINYGRYNSKQYYFPKEWEDKRRVLVNEVVVGNRREYLKEKLGGGYFYLMSCPLKHRLFGKENISYYNILNLRNFPRNEWRSLIKQAQIIEKEYRETFTNFTNVEIPEEWIKNRKTKRTSNYSSLNKQEGEITIAYGRKSAKGGYSLVFEKNTYKIKNSSSVKGVIIYSSEKKDFNIEFFNYLKKQNYSLAIIGKNEVKNIKHLNQFKHISEFMKLTLFRKYYTATKAKIILSSLYNILNNTKEEIPVLDALCGKYKEHYTKIKIYVNKYANEDLHLTEIGKELEKYAEENNIFDPEMQPIIDEISEFLKSVSIINYIKFKERDYKESDEDFNNRKKEYLNLIHKFLIFEKIHKNNFENWTLCPPIESELITENTTENELF